MSTVQKIRELELAGEQIPVPAGATAYDVSVAAATAVLSYNLLQSETWRTVNYRRVLLKGGLAGSAAINDAVVDIYVGQVKVATLRNRTAGVVLPSSDSDMRTINIPVPAGVELSAIVTDAPATNPLNLTLEFAP